MILLFFMKDYKKLLPIWPEKHKSETNTVIFINSLTNIFVSWSSYSKSRVPIFIGSENFISALHRLLKCGASSRLPFGPNSVWDSIETTIGKTHPTLVRRTSTDLLFRANYCRNRGRLFEDFGDIPHVAEQCQNAND